VTIIINNLIKSIKWLIFEPHEYAVDILTKKSEIHIKEKWWNFFSPNFV